MNGFGRDHLEITCNNTTFYVKICMKYNECSRIIYISGYFNFVIYANKNKDLAYV